METTFLSLKMLLETYTFSLVSILFNNDFCYQFASNDWKKASKPLYSHSMHHDQWKVFFKKCKLNGTSYCHTLIFFLVENHYMLSIGRIESFLVVIDLFDLVQSYSTMDPLLSTQLGYPNMTIWNVYRRIINFFKLGSNISLPKILQDPSNHILLTKYRIYFC